MSYEEDAEWFDVDKEFGTVRPGKSTTQAPFPTRTPLPTFPEPHDGDEKVEPDEEGSSTLVAVVGALGGVLLMAVIIILLILLILRRKMKRAPPPLPDRQQGDYSIRVEDVAHINIGDSENSYVNTTDLRRLISTVRGTKKEPTPVQRGINNPSIPDVLKVTSPFATSRTATEFNDTLRDCVTPKLPIIKGSTSNVATVTTEKSVDNRSHNAYAVVALKDCSPLVVRPAPPPPVSGTQKLLAKSDCEMLVTPTGRQNKPAPPAAPKSKPLAGNDNSKQHKFPTPFTTSHFSGTQEDTDPKVILTADSGKQKPAIKPTPPVAPKPKKCLAKPLLPPLKMGLLPLESSQRSTPDTSHTDITPLGVETMTSCQDTVVSTSRNNSSVLLFPSASVVPVSDASSDTSVAFKRAVFENKVST